jgi:hypothetical protein
MLMPDKRKDHETDHQKTPLVTRAGGCLSSKLNEQEPPLNQNAICLKDCDDGQPNPVVSNSFRESGGTAWNRLSLEQIVPPYSVEKDPFTTSTFPRAEITLVATVRFHPQRGRWGRTRQRHNWPTFTPPSLHIAML